MTWKSNRSVGIGFLKLSARLTQHQRRVSVAIFDYPMKHKLLIMYNSPVNGHRPDFSLVSAYGNNSRKRTAPLTDTFFQFPRVSAYERVDCISITWRLLEHYELRDMVVCIAVNVSTCCCRRTCSGGCHGCWCRGRHPFTTWTHDDWTTGLTDGGGSCHEWRSYLRNHSCWAFFREDTGYYQSIIRH